MSYPFPVHWGDLTWHPLFRRWIATARTFDACDTFHRDRKHDGLQWLGSTIGARYRADMRSRFTGPQRRAIGMGQCPTHVACRDLGECPIERPDHSHLCKRSPANPYTVYCDDHFGAAYG